MGNGMDSKTMKRIFGGILQRKSERNCGGKESNF